MVKLCETIAVSPEEMRHAYCNALIEAAKKDPRIVSLDCDLSSSCGTTGFRKAFPDRAFNLGIQEQNACAMAGGLSAAGLVPFFHTFAVFATRRVYDQAFLSCAYAGQNVKSVGCDAGVSAAFNGGTHMAFEDIGIMRLIPHITIVEPSDPAMMRSLLPQIAETEGVFYLRMPRKKVYKVYEEGSSFTLGKAAVIRDGSDVTLIASGMEVVQALRAADMLAQEGISARVVDMFTRTASVPAPPKQARSSPARTKASSAVSAAQSPRCWWNRIPFRWNALAYRMNSARSARRAIWRSSSV